MSSNQTTVVEYPIDLFKKKKCLRCEQQRVFYCEHDTKVKDELQTIYAEEGRFYLKARRSISKEIQTNKSTDKSLNFTKEKTTQTIPTNNSTLKSNDFSSSINNNKNKNVSNRNQINHSKNELSNVNDSNNHISRPKYETNNNQDSKNKEKDSNKKSCCVIL